MRSREPNLSPTKWDPDMRREAEQRESRSWTPSSAQTLRGRNGVISATVSPIAVQAGVEALRQGGNAADAAVLAALTQVATQLGSVVSYAGIMSALYYDAKTAAVSSLDAGYMSYRGETDPRSIPDSDISLLTGGPIPETSSDFGRQTLVPGFMAGIEAMHVKFGRLPFGELFAPAVWYAENGVTVSPQLSAYFEVRQGSFSRTAGGRRFLHQAGNDLPRSGDLFRQPELAATLRAVARDGAQTMYTGDWAKEYVAAVERNGGRATLQDLAAYRPLWGEPARASAFGHEICVGGPPNLSAYQLVVALNTACELRLGERGAYWQDPQMFCDLSRICEVVAGAPALPPQTADLLRSRGVDITPRGQRTPEYAKALAALLPELFGGSRRRPHHSNAVVVIDKDGNVAAMTHTIYTVIWGGAGIVVGEIPIPDSAGHQQERLTEIAPGAHVPNEIVDTIVRNAKHEPVLASAGIGSSALPETLRTIVSVIGQGHDLATVAAAPPLLMNVDSASYDLPLSQRPVIVPTGAYNAAFHATLRSLGMTIVESPMATTSNVRGTLAQVAVDPNTGECTAAEVPGIPVFVGTE